jgi:hypothetical protein
MLHKLEILGLTSALLHVKQFGTSYIIWFYIPTQKQTGTALASDGTPRINQTYALI